MWFKDNREISYDDGLKFAKKNKMLFFETSAKNGNNIENIFKKKCGIYS